MFMDKFICIQGDYKIIVQNFYFFIFFIFGVDEFGYCFEWNLVMEGLIGWKKDEVIFWFFYEVVRIILEVLVLDQVMLVEVDIFFLCDQVVGKFFVGEIFGM